MAFVRSFRSKMENNSSSPQSNFSFKIKKLDQKIQRNVPELANEDNSQKDFIKSLENKKIKSSAPKTKEKKKELVIPHIKNNNWRLPNADKSVSSLEDLAIKEILDESAKANEDWEKRENRDHMIIPLLIQNKIPDGYETETKMDVTLRPNDSTLTDYENVPVKEYGYALLRGMGWKPGYPIGDKNKKAVTPVEVVVRPKGLGLGAGQNSTNKKSSVEEENLILKRGCFVYIEKGQHTGEYGQVEGLDEDNGRVIVKLAKSEEKITLPELFIRVVTEREYNKESRIINKRKYEEHKNKLVEEKYHDVKKEHKPRNSSRNNDRQERPRDKYTEEKIKRRRHSPENKR
ncbi:G-patch domain and KOW motifs-containing protein-like isoform X1 [Centruroides sculpturatus]|uniref:G-patch domain and KOW motifs-containing protein-like isoform X1 n=1 Tax=Centruroides sculpturatus TaxID=218467 RepID=UPI000C6D9836|nr:G-patch domain and KOW motifs-containing protein-like isoform X1 [Centruroides sculpturatus]